MRLMPVVSASKNRYMKKRDVGDSTGYLIPWCYVPQLFSIGAWQSPPQYMLAILYWLRLVKQSVVPVVSWGYLRKRLRTSRG